MSTASISQDHWLELISQCRSSGLTDRQWCIQNGIPTSTFYYHVKALRKKACEIPETSVAATQKQEVVQIPLWETESHPDTVPVSSPSVCLEMQGIRIEIHEQAGADVIRNTLYIEAVAPDSVEMKTAELLSGIDGTMMFRYNSKDTFQTLYVYLSEYQSGKRISHKKVLELSYEDVKSAKNGLIVITPDFDNFTAKLIAADEYSKYMTEMPILEGVANREYYCILRSLADSDAFQSGRCAEHNGRPETLAIIN